jgi:hypothetical protein
MFPTLLTGTVRGATYTMIGQFIKDPNLDEGVRVFTIMQQRDRYMHCNGQAGLF